MNTKLSLKSISLATCFILGLLMTRNAVAYEYQIFFYYPPTLDTLFKNIFPNPGTVVNDPPFTTIASFTSKVLPTNLKASIEAIDPFDIEITKDTDYLEQNTITIELGGSSKATISNIVFPALQKALTGINLKAFAPPTVTIITRTFIKNAKKQDSIFNTSKAFGEKLKQSQNLNYKITQLSIWNVSTDSLVETFNLKGITHVGATVPKLKASAAAFVPKTGAAVAAPTVDASAQIGKIRKIIESIKTRINSLLGKPTVTK